MRIYPLAAALLLLLSLPPEPKGRGFPKDAPGRLTSSEPPHAVERSTQILGPALRQRIVESGAIRVSIGLIPHAAQGVGHMGLLLQMGRDLSLLTHRFPKSYISTLGELIKSFTRGVPAAILTQAFSSSTELEEFAVGMGWTFTPVDVEDGKAAAMAWLNSLDRSSASKGQEEYRLSKGNCQTFVLEILAKARPRRWTVDDVYSWQPRDTFAHIATREMGPPTRDKRSEAGRMLSGPGERI